MGHIGQTPGGTREDIPQDTQGDIQQGLREAMQDSRQFRSALGARPCTDR